MTLRTLGSRPLRRLSLLAGMAGAALLLGGCGSADGTLQMPVQASAQAETVDWIYYFIFWLSAFYFVHIMAVMAWFMWRYRRQEGKGPERSPHHNLPLEVAWSLPPIVLVVFMFYWGFRGYVDMTVPPSDATKIEVLAQKWAWQFTYPNGGTSPELHVVKDRPFQMVMESQDVLHSFFIPNFRVKQDVVPGRFTTVWFQPTRVPKDGEVFWLFCTEYCGDQHSTMQVQVVVHETEASWKAWVDGLGEADGQSLYRLHCQACHNLEGTIIVGPSFRGLYGSDRQVFDPATGQTRSQKADEDYIRESIVDPGALLSREGREFDNQMGALNFGQKLSAEEIDMLVEFIKEQSE